MTKVLCGGCFNKVHKGHVYFLKKCKKHGDELIVVIANDKNNNKPYAVGQKERKKNVEKLGIADTVIVGHPTDMLKTIEKERPDVICLGYDQNFSFINELKERGIKIVRIEKYGVHSSDL